MSTNGLTPSTIDGLCVTSRYDRQYLFVSWVGCTLADYYKLYRSATPYSTPESISTLYPSVSGLQGITYIDYPPQLLDDSFYYYTTQTQGLTESVKQTAGITCEPYSAFENTPTTPTFYAMDVFDEYFDNTMMEEKFEEIRKRTLALLLNDGEDTYLLKRRWSGTRCVCWDTMALQAQARCPICFGTGFVGGYYAKIQIKVRLTPAGRVVTVYEEGLRKEYEPRSWTIWTPRLRDRDVIIRQNNQRLEVLNVTDYPRWRALRTRQDFLVKLLLPEDIVMAVPI